MPLLVKYLITFVALTTGVLLVSGVSQTYFTYQENVVVLGQLQHEKALVASATIEHFVGDIRALVSAATPPPRSSEASSLEQREAEFRRLLRQAPAVTDVTYVDPEGREQLRVSRLSLNLLGSGLDRSREPSVAGARRSGSYFSPAYFRDGSEPYMTIAATDAAGDGGVIVAEVNLKLIWDVISRIRVGEHGYAYVVDSSGNLIAHPDLSLVLRRPDLAGMTQVQR